MRQRQAMSRKKPKHAIHGLAMGAQGLGKGIFDGVTGIVLRPIEGAKQVCYCRRHCY